MNLPTFICLAALLALSIPGPFLWAAPGDAGQQDIQAMGAGLVIAPHR